MIQLYRQLQRDGAGDRDAVEQQAPAVLRADAVRWSSRHRIILDDVSITVRRGETLGLLGPNGAGKSSLLRVLAGLRRVDRGAVYLDGLALARYDRRTVARRIAFVEQQSATELDMTVEQVVRLGRIPHNGWWPGDTGGDDRAVERALERSETTALRHRDWHTLSGGEQQRVQIARALAQEPTELLLDEPTNHLDIRHQFDVLALVCRLPVTAVISLHDLASAALFCDRIVLLDSGRVVAIGPPAAVLTPARIRQVYGVDIEVEPDAAGPGRPAIRYRPRVAGAPQPRRPGG